MFSAVKQGKETAVKFYKEHVEEVKRVIPKEKLLVFEVITFYKFRIIYFHVYFVGEAGLGASVQVPRCSCSSMSLSTSQ